MKPNRSAAATPGVPAPAPDPPVRRSAWLRLCAPPLLILRCLGWVVLLASTGIFAAERSGALLHWTRTLVSDRLGPVGGDLTIEHLELHWWQPGISLHGIALGPAGRDISLETLRADLRWDSRWPRISAVEADSGHIRLSPALANGLRGLAPEPRPGPRRERADDRPTTVHVNDLRLDMAMPEWGEVPGGRIDLLFAAGAAAGDASPRLTGRFAPTLVKWDGAAAEQPSGVIYLRGALEDHQLRVRATGRSLVMNADLLPTGSILESLRPWQPLVTLDLDGTALFPLGNGAAGGNGAPELHARLVLSAGGARIPHTGDPLTAVAAQAALHIKGQPRPGEGAASDGQPTWDLRGSFSGAWRGASLDGDFVASNAADELYALRLWLNGQDLPLGEEITAAAGGNPGLERIWDALEPRGRGSARAALRFPMERVANGQQETVTSASDSADTGPPPEFLVVAELAGEAAITYHGFERDGLRNSGFPAPLEGVRGQVFYGISPTSGRRGTLGLVDLSGTIENEPVRVRGCSFSPHRAAPPWHAGELFIGAEAERLHFGPTLRRALAGLSGIIPPENLWDRYGFNGGSLAAEVAIRKDPTAPRTAVSVALDLRESGLTWAQLPVPMHSVSGQVEVRSNGRPAEEGGRWGVRFNADGRLGFSGEALQLAGRVVGNAAGLRESIEVAVPHLPLVGGDVAVVRETLPAVEGGLTALSPRGHASIAYARSRPRAGGAARTTVEITPLEPVQLRPERFQMITREVGGRILISAHEPPPGTPGAANSAATSEVLLEPLLGTWEDGVPVAIRARIPSEGLAHLDILGAGLAPARRSLLGSLGAAISDRGGNPADLSALALTGRLDFSAHLEYPVEAEQDGESLFSFHLRDNSFATEEGFALVNLRGTLTLEEDHLRGEMLTGLLGQTPVVLRGASFQPSPSGYVFETDLTARDVPLDAEHLRFFLDEKTLAGLFGELGLTGTLDIPSGHLTLLSTAAAGRSLSFSGDVLPRQASLDIGVPLSVTSAALQVENLTFEGDRVRALALVKELNGTVAGQQLEGASAILTYIEPHLTLENFSGRLEGGRLRSFGGSEDLGGPFFALDLAAPYSFQATVDLRDAAVAGFTRQLFPSDFADRGQLDCELRLVGEFGNLTSIRGGGRLELSQSNLWSIPVFRTLFSQLGQESTATFHRIGARFTIDSGRLDMSGILVKSDLLKLVGSGVLDFDGGLHHDFEVRYSLVDKLGPLNRILYLIQNSLLSVALRGDLTRPKVLMRGVLSTLLGMRGDARDALPIPEVTALPPRW